MSAKIIPVEPFDFYIFGATGDLALNKLLPALLFRYLDGQLANGFHIYGISRSEQSTEKYRQQVAQKLQSIKPDLQSSELKSFLEHINYLALDVKNADSWAKLVDCVKQSSYAIDVFYLSVAPDLFGTITEKLRDLGLIKKQTRLVVEKPFGKDLLSAQEIEAKIATAFPEKSIYRIDHYLGKETVQNLMVLRFANSFLEPMWNAQFIDHVQITASESVGVGNRVDYYDGVGATRDMLQNHLLQLLCLISMEAPYSFQADVIRDEKVKVMKSLRPIIGKDAEDLCVTGQYAASDDSPGFQEEATNPNTTTETFVAIKAHIDNLRWAGVPFYLRTGKHLKARHTEISIHFKEPRHHIFHEVEQKPSTKPAVFAPPA